MITNFEQVTVVGDTHWGINLAKYEGCLKRFEGKGNKVLVYAEDVMHFLQMAVGKC